MDRLLQHTIPRKSSDCPKNEDTPVERIVVILHLKTSCQHPLIKHTQIHAPTQETPQKPTAPTQLRKALSFNATPQRLLQEVARTHIFPVTFFTALPRLPFALVPFAFSQFILIEALAHQGWIDLRQLARPRVQSPDLSCHMAHRHPWSNIMQRLWDRYRRYNFAHQSCACGGFPGS